MEGRILTSIDVGTSKVCTTIARMKDGYISEILGTGVVPSHGIQKAIVLDIHEPAVAIRESVREAERSSHTQVKSAFIGITGHHVASLNNRGALTFAQPNHRVSDKDIDRAIGFSKDLSLPKQTRVIHAIPRQYFLDGRVASACPVGLHGHRLEVETHVVTAGITFIQNLTECVQSARIGVMDLILEPLASAEAVLEDEEKEAGVILVDIGAGTTDVTVYKGRTIWYSRALPLAGNNVTRDIAVGLGVPFSMAEELKMKYGSVAVEKKAMPRFIDLDHGENRRVPYEEFCRIIEARLEEIMGMVLSGLPPGLWKTWEPASLVLCGGTANLPGIEALAQEVSQLRVRIGRPRGLPERMVTLHDPAYATGIGLLLWGAKYGQSKVTSTEGVLQRFFDRLAKWHFKWPGIKFGMS